MSEHKSQRDKILRALLCNEEVTPLSMFRRFGCLRLSGRILEIRKDGYPVKTNIVEARDKRYASYVLEVK